MTIEILPASLADYPIIQNMARFYVYDFSRYCGFISKDWAIPKDGLYECFDFKKYFEDQDKKAYLIKLDDGELVGFVLLDKQATTAKIDHNMGEFFVLAKFQGKGVAKEIAKQIWNMHPGKWEVSVIPENKPALAFWRKTISAFTNGKYIEEIRTIDYDKDQPRRYILNFDTMDSLLRIANITENLVQELIAQQFPEYAHLSIRSVKSQGHDNRTFRLGDEMLVRLPSGEEYVRQVAKEHKWLPLLAAKLPLPIPESIAIGRPSNDYPFNWSIYRWLEGDSANTVELNDINLETIAIQLAHFLQSLHKFDADIDSAPQLHNWWRAAHTSTYDKETRELINNLKDVIDTEKASALWQKAISSKWEKRPVWVHGDVASGNILLKDSKLCAVIDFGCLGVGDPACDLTIAWTFFKNNSRQVFKNAFSFDDKTWDRARGWTLWKAMFTFVEIEDKNSLEAIKQLQIINDILDEDKL